MSLPRRYFGTKCIFTFETCAAIEDNAGALLAGEHAHKGIHQNSVWKVIQDKSGSSFPETDEV